MSTSSDAYPHQIGFNALPAQPFTDSPPSYETAVEGKPPSDDVGGARQPLTRQPVTVADAAAAHRNGSCLARRCCCGICLVHGKIKRRSRDAGFPLWLFYTLLLVVLILVVASGVMIYVTVKFSGIS